MSSLRGLLFSLALLGASCGEDTVPAKAKAGEHVVLRGKLLDESGEPVPHKTVALDLGRQSLEVGAGRVVYLAAGHRSTRSSEDGSFAFDQVPARAKVHLVCMNSSEEREPERFVSRAVVLQGVARELSPAHINLRMIAARSVVGEIVPPGPDFRIYVESGAGWAGSIGTPDKESGRFHVSGLVPGDARLVLQRGNYVVESRAIHVPAGKDLDLGRMDIPPSTPRSVQSPEVAARRVLLVDRAGKPAPKLRFMFSTPSADGASESDEKGEVLMKDGGIEIGGPPFRLYLEEIERASDGKKFCGTASESGDTVTVTVAPMTRVRLSFQEAGAPVADLVVVVRGRNPDRTTLLEKEGTTFEAWLPPGGAQLRLYTVQGTVIEKGLEVPVIDVFESTLDLP